MGEYLYEDLTRIIIGAAFDVHNILGKGLSEKAYENALVVRLRQLGLTIEQQKTIPLLFASQKVTDQEVDILVEDKIIVETKARDHISKSHVSQVLGYLKNTPYRLALILNFGSKVQIKRLIRSRQNLSSYSS